jgi:hypothetical protein
MYYAFSPPYFIIDPQTSFDEAWEVFCCQLLQLEHQTGEIHRRIPPESGVDLFWPAQHIAYQCKSTKKRQGHALDLAKMKKSLQDAQRIQQDLGWQQYIFCTNVEVTEPQCRALRQIYSHIDFYGPERWDLLCRRFHPSIAHRFQVMLPLIPPYPTTDFEKVQQSYNHDFASSLQQAYQDNQLLKAHFFIDRYKGGFEVQLPLTFTVAEAVNMLVKVLQLPGTLYLPEYDLTIAPLHRLLIENQAVPLDQQLGSLTLPDHPLIMLLRINPQAIGSASYTFERTGNRARTRTKSTYTPVEKAACAAYQQRIEEALDRVSASFRNEL